jgi:hypothetical protein
MHIHSLKLLFFFMWFYFYLLILISYQVNMANLQHQFERLHGASPLSMESWVVHNFYVFEMAVQ